MKKICKNCDHYKDYGSFNSSSYCDEIEEHINVEIECTGSCVESIEPDPDFGCIHFKEKGGIS